MQSDDLTNTIRDIAATQAKACGATIGDDEPDRCPDCNALVDGDGYSIDKRCCFYCKAD